MILLRNPAKLVYYDNESSDKEYKGEIYINTIIKVI